MFNNRLLRQLKTIPLWLTLFAVSTLLFLHPLYNVGWYVEKRIYQIIIILSLVFSLAFFSETRKKLFIVLYGFSPLIQASLFMFFVLGVVSSFFSKLPPFALLETSNFFFMFLLAIFIAFSKAQFSNKILISAFVACAIGYAVSFFSALTAGIVTVGIIDFNNLLMGVVNRRFLNQFQSLSFPLLVIAPLLLTDKKFIRVSLIFLASFWFMLMILSDGRGVIVATVTGILLSGLLLPQARKIWWKYSAFIIGIGITLFFLMNWLLSFYIVIKGDVLRQTTSGRISIWLDTLTLIKDSPLIGMGPMQYAFSPDHSISIAHPHNITLQLMSEWGIPASLIIISIISFIFWKWIQQQRKVKALKHADSLFSIALTSAFIAGLTHGQFSGVFVMPLSQLTFVLISGWMIGNYMDVNQSPIKEIKHVTLKSTLLLVLLLSASVSIIYGLQPQLKYLTSTELPNSSIVYKKGNYPAYNAPRYWLNTFVGP